MRHGISGAEWRIVQVLWECGGSMTSSGVVEKLNDEVIYDHLAPDQKDMWVSTEMWDNEYSHDRLWS